MTTVVVADYPAERLPEDVRQGIRPGARVKVTVVEEPSAPERRSLTSFIGAGKGVYASPEEATAFIRELRDEWD